MVQTYKGTRVRERHRGRAYEGAPWAKGRAHVTEKRGAEGEREPVGGERRANGRETPRAKENGTEGKERRREPSTRGRNEGQGDGHRWQ